MNDCFTILLHWLRVVYYLHCKYAIWKGDVLSTTHLRKRRFLHFLSSTCLLCAPLVNSSTGFYMAYIVYDIFYKEAGGLRQHSGAQFGRRTSKCGIGPVPLTSFGVPWSPFSRAIVVDRTSPSQMAQWTLLQAGCYADIYRMPKCIATQS